MGYSHSPPPRLPPTLAVLCCVSSVCCVWSAQSAAQRHTHVRVRLAMLGVDKSRPSDSSVPMERHTGRLWRRRTARAPLVGWRAFSRAKSLAHWVPTTHMQQHAPLVLLFLYGVCLCLLSDSILGGR